MANQHLLKEPEKEVCSFDNAEIAALKASGAFPTGAIIRAFDQNIRSDASSDEWVCFLAYPFSIGLRYLFPDFISRFFDLNGLSFAQTMPMVWRVLMMLDQIKSCHIPNLCIEDLLIAYCLRSHGNSRFLLFSTSKNPFILKATKNEDGWKRKFFFVKRDSIDKVVDLPVKWLTSAKIPEVFDLEELDSYFGPVHVKKKPSPKAATSSTPTSSKATAIPKPSPATKAHTSSAQKRKETDSPATSETFPYENHGFVEASGFMTYFLNQGLECLMHLYEESCGLNKMLEVKLKKAEVTIVDQGMIAAAKSQHCEDKFKAMT
ncbi:hypothetical protein Hanom_Chr03g00207841 [Helianthus anomalus]